MSKVTEQISEVALGLMLLLFVFPNARAQDQPSPPEAGRISNTLRSAAYPEAIYPRGIMPDWDRGYVIHHEIEMNHRPDTLMAVMYDATGKRILEGRIWPPGAGSVRIRRTAATHEGAILAAGSAIMQDGKIQHFIVKTDLAGNTARSVLMGGFGAEQICEASDGTVWSVGQVIGTDGMRQHDADILRHYSFETGLLHSFLPQGTVEAPVRSETAWFSPFGSYVRCGKNKVSVYLRFTNEYVEVNTSSFELMRWKLDEAVVQQREASGLAVTEDGRVYASFDANGIRGAEQVRGLYQIKAVSGNPIAELLPLAGTITLIERGKLSPPGTFTMLWGADGNQLVVWRMENNDSFLSWVNVIHIESTD
jgi:hypothetical protein